MIKKSPFRKGTYNDYESTIIRFKNNNSNNLDEPINQNNGRKPTINIEFSDNVFNGNS